MLRDALAVVCGSAVGLVLGLIGGGGSILAVPLLVYVVGVPSPHVGIGTSAIAVAASAFASLLPHARIGNVKWRSAAIFSVGGMAGAALGSTLGKQFDGQRLLTLFGVLMIVVAATMLLTPKPVATATEPYSDRLTRPQAIRLAGYGALVGLASGFFGIGGGFLIVPGLVAATGMPLILAIGSSLVSVTAFGLTTALNYATSGWVDWRLALMFIAGGAIGSLFGARIATRLATRKQALSRTFAGIVASAGVYMVVRGLMALAH